MNHAQVHDRHGGISLTGAVDAMLSGENQRIGNAVQRDGQPAALAAEHLFVMLEFFLMFLKR